MQRQAVFRDQLPNHPKETLMRRFHQSLTAMLVLLLFVTACAPVAPASGGAAAPEAPAAAEPGGGVIKVGFMGPLTGGAAFLGSEQQGFAQVAVDIFNERTGLNVQLVAEDTELNPDVAKTVAERLAADPQVIVVVGPAGSQECESTKPVFAEAGLPHLTQSCTRTDLTSPENTTPTFFRPIPRDADQSATDADYMINTLQVKSAYLVDDQSSYAVGLCDELQEALEAAGVTVERASVTQDDTDFSSLVTAILAAGSEVVFFPGQIGNQLSTLVIQLREQGYTGVYFLADAGFSPDVVNAAGEALNGAYVSVFSPDPKQVPQAEEYITRYAAQYNPEFGAFGGAAALTAYIALDAIERCSQEGDVTRACVLEKLKATNLPETPLGIPIQFDENNQVVGSRFFLFQVEDGAFTLLN
jgi:branched-chain amino acid transport system substrate-binding protein